MMYYTFLLNKITQGIIQYYISFIIELYLLYFYNKQLSEHCV